MQNTHKKLAQRNVEIILGIVRQNNEIAQNRLCMHAGIKGWTSTVAVSMHRSFCP